MSRQMRLRIALSALFTALVYAGFSYGYANLASTAGQSDSGVPRLKIAETVQDLGDVPPRQLCELTFVVRNVGTQRLVLSALHSECECVRAQAPEIIISPGRSAVVKLAFQAPADAGSYDLSARYATNDVAYPLLKLVARADVGLPAGRRPYAYLPSK